MNGHKTIATIIASFNRVGLVSEFIAGKVFAPKVDHPKSCNYPPTMASRWQLVETSNIEYFFG
jgi:hypothetical protein